MKLSIKILSISLIAAGFMWGAAPASAQGPAQVVTALQGIQIDTGSAGLSTRVAPGELLPISIKLANFGGGKRVDVLMKYGIFADSGEKIYSTEDTVAVETTASFIKTIQIPFTAAPGNYVAKTGIIYEGQLVPASTEFPFTVEGKVLGLFKSDFIRYSGAAAIIGALILLIGYAIVSARRMPGAVRFDYSGIPRDVRTFYEILSDTISQMRARVGDEALRIASHIEGLRIDEDTGKVLALTAPPAKIIASLVSEYEKHLGKKVSFHFRNEK